MHHLIDPHLQKPTFVSIFILARSAVEATEGVESGSYGVLRALGDIDCVSYSLFGPCTRKLQHFQFERGFSSGLKRQTQYRN